MNRVIKKNVSKEDLQVLASSYVNVPTILHYDPEKKIMEKLDMTIADMYGDNVPAYLKKCNR